MKKVLKITAWILGSIVALLIILVVGVNLYFTPARLTNIVNKEASKYLKADVKASNVTYTFLSTFPNLIVSIDSLYIKSKTLDKLPPHILRGLPGNRDFLASTGKFSCGINVVKAIKGDIELKDIELAKPKINLVSYNDSINNFSILPAIKLKGRMPHISVNTVNIPAPVEINYFDAASRSSARLGINGMTLSKKGASDSYHISFSGTADGSLKNFNIPKPLPVDIDGNLKLNFKPLAITLSEFSVNIPNIRTTTDLSMTAESSPVINSLTTRISSEDAFLIADIFPQLIPENLQGISGELPLDIELNLTEPYTVPSGRNGALSISDLPAFTTNVDIADADISYPVTKKQSLNLSDIQLSAFLDIDPKNPGANKVEVYNCSLKSVDSKLAVSGSAKEILSGNPLIDADVKCLANISTLTQVLMPGSSLKIEGDLDADTKITCRLANLSVNDSNKFDLDGKFKSNSLKITDNTKGLTASVSGLSLDLDASLRKFSGAASSQWTPHATSEGDHLIAQRTNHTPLYLVAEMSPIMQSFLNLFNLDADLSVEKGALLADAYPAFNSFSNLHISSDLDSVCIKNLNLESRSSSAKISGKVKGLRKFLTSSSPTLLTADIDANFSDVNINELAGTYYAGVGKTTGKPADYTVPPLGPYTAADSLCVVIPRNLSACLRLHSDRAEYQGWTFKPLSTEITLHDGIARIGNLKIGSDFCTALADWTYSTENLDDIFMHLNIGVDNFDFDRFFTAFPTLVTDTPELANLSGELSVKAEGEFLMFPDMFLNTPSLAGKLTLSGDSIQYFRDKKTARITHFMLLRGDGPLKVDDFSAHGYFHDNLLQLEPFILKCGGYEIMIGGVNNLQGEIYYHLGLMHSPFHFPFGINLVGNYHHPEIRFGGNGIKDGRERRISADLQETANVNIMRQLKHGWLLFIENAAKYDAKNNHDYVFNVH